MPTFWPRVPLTTLTPREQRQRLSAEVQRRVVAGELDASEAEQTLDRLLKQARLVPRSVSPDVGSGRRPERASRD